MVKIGAVVWALAVVVSLCRLKPSAKSTATISFSVQGTNNHTQVKIKKRKL